MSLLPLKMLFIFVVVGCGLSIAHAQMPSFERYPASIQKFQTQKLQLIGRGKWFKSILTDLSKQNTNFAGHYVLDSFGCGGGCQSLAVVNLKTGRGFIHPEDFSDCYSETEGFVGRDYQFKANSRLVIVIGNRKGANPALCEEVAYVVKGDAFVQVKQRWVYQQKTKVSLKP